MDNRILALLLLIGVVGSVAALEPSNDRVPRNAALEDGLSIVDLVRGPRAKRAVGDTYGESENSNRTESTPSLTTKASTTPKPTPKPTTIPTPKPTTTSTAPTTQPSTPETTLTTKPTTAEVTYTTTPRYPETTPTPEPTSPETTLSTKPNSAEMMTEPTPYPTSETTTPEPTTTTSEPTTTTTTTSKPTTAPKPTTTPAPPAGCSPNSQTTPAPGDSPCTPPGLLSRSNFDSDSKDPNEMRQQPPRQNPGYGQRFGPVNNYGNNRFGYPARNSIPATGNFVWTSTSNFPGAASASASASSSGGSHGGGMVFPDSRPSVVNTRGGFVDNGPSYPSYGGNGLGPSGFGTFAFPEGFGDFDPDPFHIQAKMDEDFRQMQKQFELQQRAFLDESNGISSRSGGGAGGAGLGNTNAAMASINVGSRGGHQAGFISPVAPGIESRFSEALPAPSGNSYGVFASSSSSSGVGPDGKQFNHKSATTGVNDNGKISFRTVQD